MPLRIGEHLIKRRIGTCQRVFGGIPKSVDCSEELSVSVRVAIVKGIDTKMDAHEQNSSFYKGRLVRLFQTTLFLFSGER